MRFSCVHNSIHVLDLDRSLAFYAEALGLREMRRLNVQGRTLVYLSDGHSGHELELIHVTDRRRRTIWAKMSSTWRSP